VLQFLSPTIIVAWFAIARNAPQPAGARGHRHLAGGHFRLVARQPDDAVDFTALFWGLLRRLPPLFIRLILRR
jgi:hypothetical protein